MRVLLIVFLLLLSETAYAKKFAFGDKDSVGFLMITPIVDNEGKKLFLGYLKTEVNFFLPIYNKDGGYVLGQVSNFGNIYYRLNMLPDRLKEWQQNGMLPKKLPEYHIQTIDPFLIVFIIGVLLYGLYEIIKPKVDKRNMQIALLVAIFLPYVCYIVYKTIPQGEMKHNLISKIDKWNNCILEKDYICIKECAPSDFVRMLEQMSKTDIVQSLELFNKTLSEQGIMGVDRKLEKITDIKRSKAFENVYTATGTMLDIYYTDNKIKKTPEKFFAISRDGGETWYLANRGTKQVVDILSFLYPFVPELKNY